MALNQPEYCCTGSFASLGQLEVFFQITDPAYFLIWTAIGHVSEPRRVNNSCNVLFLTTDANKSADTDAVAVPMESVFPSFERYTSLFECTTPVVL